MCCRTLSLIVAILLPLFFIKAQWSADPAVNNAICTAANNQMYPQIISDGNGGAIITWMDVRSGTYWDIYAQRINSSGVIEWTADGVAICTATDAQMGPQIISDGNGGAIIAWDDRRNGSDYDIYVQRINSSGVVQWTLDGVAICTATTSQINSTLVSDGSGGAIIIWIDSRSSFSRDIYAQRINSSGVVQWTANGIALCTFNSVKNYVRAVSSATGSTIIAWMDNRNDADYDIYAQKINSAGEAQWSTDGVAICTAAYAQSEQSIVDDGNGGAIVVWHDYRSNTNYDIYSQKINATGSVQWTSNGVAICTQLSTQTTPRILSDLSGGAFITWEDLRSGYFKIYVQKINTNGVIQWTENGVSICTVSGDQRMPIIVTDGSGGAIISWVNDQSGNFDIYAQRVNTNGTVQWTSNGAAISTAPYSQDYPTIVSNGSGGAIVAWHDLRSGDSQNRDIYTSRLFSDGALPIELVSFTARVSDNSIVELSWSTATEINNYGFEIEKRSVGEVTQRWKTIGFVQGAGTSNSPREYGFTDNNLSLGRYAYRIKQIDNDGSFIKYYGETEIEIGASLKHYSLLQNYPNPFNPTTTFTFHLPVKSFVSLKIFDLMGREVTAIVKEQLSAGTHSMQWNSQSLPGGAYFYRFQAGASTETKKLVLLR